MMNTSVWIADYIRTPFSKAHPVKKNVDAYENLSGIELLTALILSRKLKNPEYYTGLDELTVSCAIPVGEQWNFGGRYPLYLANLPQECSTKSVEQQCGSGLAAIISGFDSICSGRSKRVLCGGYENMTRVPIGPKLFEAGMLTVPEGLKSDSTGFDINVALNMGLTAENVARKYGIERESMDEFALRSHRLAYENKEFLAEENFFIKDSEGLPLLEYDANVREGTNTEKLNGLKPAFMENGQITPGNSSPLSSGAAMLELMADDEMEHLNIEKRCRIIAGSFAGTHPEFMGEAVIPASEKLLKSRGLTPNDIDLWEINEAFACVPQAAIKHFNLSEDKVNVAGGALAVGHPLGATGLRIAGTLSRQLSDRKLRYGIATACIGGGQGISVLIENSKAAA